VVVGGGVGEELALQPIERGLVVPLSGALDGGQQLGDRRQGVGAARFFSSDIDLEGDRHATDSR